MAELTSFLTAFGVSAPAGLNAYLPLLIVGLTARFTKLLTLNEPFTWLTNEWVLGVLGVLVLVEFFADKIAGVDHINDVINTVIRPVSGAILFAAASNVFGELHPVIAVVLGLLSAGSVHVVKSTVRPVVTASTLGMGNPIISFAEDIVAVVTTIAAILVPILVFFFVIATAAVAFYAFRRSHRPEARPLV
ncbi:MAG: DUF4126 domain-containing protein [Dehalococcoidia bacterium]